MTSESIAFEACRCRIAVAGDLLRTFHARRRFKKEASYQKMLQKNIDANTAVVERFRGIIGGAV